MLRRLEIGLVDEGCRVVRLSPESRESSATSEPTTGLAATMTYPVAPWRVGPLSPAVSIARAITELPALGSTEEERSIDVIHAWGEGCWGLALSLAKSLGADLAIEVSSRHALSLMQAFEGRAPRGGNEFTGVWMAPDEAMLSAVDRLARRWPAVCSRWGVHVPPIDETGVPASEPIEAVCVLSSGKEPASVIGLLSALARTPSAGSAPMIFLDARAVERSTSGGASVWRHAELIGLLPRLTIIPEMESRRQLVLRADVLVLADCQGEHGSLVLEAMAAGMTLVTRADRLVSISGDPSLAVLVEEPSEAGWTRALAGLLASAADARALGLAGRRHIQMNRLAHVQVRAALDAYARFMEEAPIPLRPAGNG